MNVRAFLLVYCLAFMLFASAARAEGGRVVIVHAGAADPVSAHLVDELVSLGMTVEIAPSGDEDLAALGRLRGARAVLRVGLSRRAVELWVEGAKGVEVIEEQRGEAGDAAALPLRAVEVLRGRMLLVEKAAPSSPDEPPIAPSKTPERSKTEKSQEARGSPKPLPANPEKTLKSEVRAPRFSLHVAPALTVQPWSGGISAAGFAFLGARWMASPRFGGDVFALVPVVDATIRAPEGQVLLKAAAVFVGGVIELSDPRAALGVAVGGGLGAGLLGYYGQPQSPRVEARDGAVGYVSPYARAGLVWHVWPTFGLRADVFGAVATPRPVLRLAGRPTDAYFGQPLVGVALGVEVALR